MANKYLKGGALNPVWCNERDAEIMTDNIMESISGLLNIMDIDLNLQLGEAVSISVSNKKYNEEPMNMCTIINTESEYEAKFNFIKNHSGTPEDLQLAKEIIGLK